MRRGLQPGDERREQQRAVEARVAPTPGRPWGQLTAALRCRVERAADGGEPFLVRVEHEARPVWSRSGSPDEVCHGLGVHVHEWLVLGRERDLGALVGIAVHDDRQPSGPDAWCDNGVDHQRLAADLREPEAMLFDEVERESVAPGRPWGEQRNVELHLRRGRDRLGEGRPDAVPDDRVAERVEPVIRDLHAVGAARAPRRGAGVLDRDAGRCQYASAVLGQLPCDPAGGERGPMLAGVRHGRATVVPVAEPLLVRAARCEPVERTPVWFMRQAGRSLPEYRAIRERHSFFEVAGTPELCAEVTLQPVRRHDVDAAVMFADIMTPVLGMGVGVELVEGVGPVIAEPVRTRADVERLRVPDPEEAFGHVLEAVRAVRAELRDDQAVVGFCGGPFTVAGYLIEGRPSREFAATKRLMLGEPEVWHALMSKLSDTFSAYVAAKARAGADVIQLFDSWVGALSPAHYREHVGPYSGAILRAAGTPTIHFGTGTATLLEELAAVGGDVIGLDWRIPLDVGWERLPGRAVQGNLDPAVLLAPWDVVEAEALDVLARAGGRPGHVFNLGHGVLPGTDPVVLTRLAELVRERSAAPAPA